MSSTLVDVGGGGPVAARGIMAPNALIIGAMKSSTTLLFDTLGMHPGVFTPTEKEPHYFSSPDRDAPGAWENYLALFAGRKLSQTIALEASTTYTRWPENIDTAPIIKARLGSPRLIYILRDPVERAVSHYNHSYARGYYAPGMTFGEAIERDPILLSTSRYAQQLARYDEVFGPDATLVVLADDLHKNRADTMRRVADHLGLDPFDGWDAQPSRANSAENVRASAAWRPLLQGSPLLRAAVRRMPAGLKRRLKSLRAPAPAAPKPTQHERDLALRAIAHDLLALETRIGVGARRFPSWAALRESAVTEAHPAMPKIDARVPPAASLEALAL